MEINEILNKIADGKATIKIVDDMIEIKVKRWKEETGTVGNPIKEYLSIADLQAKKTNLTKRLAKITELLSLVNL